MMRRESASIVVLAWNEWAATRACLDSLRPTLGVHDQVIVVDNGSSDQTPRGLARYPWIDVVTNEENRGFAAGCNQGAAMARNDLLVFLNNDTLPVGKWLDALLEPFADDTVVGAGARSNFVSGPQLVTEVDYGRPKRSDVSRFERQWRQRHQGELTDVDRLVGFCLAVRRDAFESVSGFDEGYGLGGFEDDDLCTRLRASGKRLVIAHGAFVHHDGHKTFDGNGLDWLALQQENRVRYEQKHGSGSAPPQLAECNVTISACLIVKDEEARLADCLSSITGLVDEIVVYDTGSTDRTIEIARTAGAVVVEGHWDDDFGRARNAALEACTGTWVLQVDADEEVVLSGDVRGELTDLDALGVEIENVGSGQQTGYTHVMMRLFRRDRGCWTGRLHEYVTARPGQPDLRAAMSSTLRLRHWGYTADVLEEKGKVDRNLRVARAELESGVGDRGRSLVNLGRALSAPGRADEALEHLSEALTLPLDGTFRRLALRTGAKLLIDEGRHVEALEWIESLRSSTLHDSVADYLQGLAFAGLGKLDEASELLATIDDVTDGDGYRLPATVVLVRRAEIHAEAQRWEEAHDCLLRSVELGLETMPWPLAARVCFEAGKDGSSLVGIVTEEDLVGIAGALLSESPPSSDCVAEALWNKYSGSPALLAWAVRLGPRLDVTRALEWSVRLRAAGLEADCPLEAIVHDERRTPLDRLRAAAVVSSGFSMDSAPALLSAVADGVPEASFRELLLELDSLAPQLLPTFVELLAGTASRCRALSSVLHEFGVIDEAEMIAERGRELARTEPLPRIVASAATHDDPRPGTVEETGVCVLGMHRSGTSAMTRVINLLGMRGPAAQDCISSAPDNPTGFWESASLTVFNDRLLHRLGGTWSEPPKLSAGWHLDPSVLDLVPSAAKAFGAVYGDSGAWVWKDPRTSLTFPFWASALRVEPVLVLAYRNPLEVWRSLDQRNGFSKAHALALWERYTTSALEAANGRPVFVTAYDDLLTDPDRWCKRVGLLLERSGVHVDVARAMPAVHQFLEQGLRHTRFAATDLWTDDDVTPSQRELWRHLELVGGEEHDAFDAQHGVAERLTRV